MYHAIYYSQVEVGVVGVAIVLGKQIEDEDE